MSQREIRTTAVQTEVTKVFVQRKESMPQQRATATIRRTSIIAPDSNFQDTATVSIEQRVDDETSKKLKEPCYTIRNSNTDTNLEACAKRLLRLKRFLDVTLSCDGHQFNCHRLVLSSSSPLLEELLLETAIEHPIVILPVGIKAHILQALIDFMYQGETTVSHSGLQDLVESAHALQITGLYNRKGQFREYFETQDEKLQEQRANRKVGAELQPESDNIGQNSANPQENQRKPPIDVLRIDMSPDVPNIFQDRATPASDISTSAHITNRQIDNNNTINTIINNPQLQLFTMIKNQSQSSKEPRSVEKTGICAVPSMIGENTPAVSLIKYTMSNRKPVISGNLPKNCDIDTANSRYVPVSTKRQVPVDRLLVEMLESSGPTEEANMVSLSIPSASDQIPLTSNQLPSANNQISGTLAVPLSVKPDNLPVSCNQLPSSSSNQTPSISGTFVVPLPVKPHNIPISPDQLPWPFLDQEETTTRARKKRGRSPKVTTSGTTTTTTTTKAATRATTRATFKATTPAVTSFLKSTTSITSRSNSKPKSKVTCTQTSGITSRDSSKATPKDTNMSPYMEYDDDNSMVFSINNLDLTPTQERIEVLNMALKSDPEPEINPTTSWFTSSVTSGFDSEETFMPPLEQYEEKPLIIEDLDLNSTQDNYEVVNLAMESDGEEEITSTVPRGSSGFNSEANILPPVLRNYGRTINTTSPQATISRINYDAGPPPLYRYNGPRPEPMEVHLPIEIDPDMLPTIDSNYAQDCEEIYDEKPVIIGNILLTRGIFPDFYDLCKHYEHEETVRDNAAAKIAAELAAHLKAQREARAAAEAFAKAKAENEAKARAKEKAKIAAAAKAKAKAERERQTEQARYARGFEGYNNEDHICIDCDLLVSQPFEKNQGKRKRSATSISKAKSKAKKKPNNFSMHFFSPTILPVPKSDRLNCPPTLIPLSARRAGPGNKKCYYDDHLLNTDENGKIILMTDQSILNGVSHSPLTEGGSPEMVILRNPRSNQPRHYSTESLFNALMAVKYGESIYKASRLHVVPRKTLRNWMKRWDIKSQFPMPAQLMDAALRRKLKKTT